MLRMVTSHLALSSETPPAPVDGSTMSGAKHHLWYHHAWCLATSHHGAWREETRGRGVGASGIAFAMTGERSADHAIRCTDAITLEEDDPCFALANVSTYWLWGCC